jgi:hypothetical protein
MGAFLAGMADLVAAVWIWALLSVSAVAAGAGLFTWGYKLGRHNRGRAVVLAAMEAVASETVALPRQRQGSEL